MDLGIADRVAVVAAASKGLGRATARSLAREGCRVAICARNEQALRVTEAELTELGGDASRVLALPLDVVAEPERFVTTAAEHFGGLHILVANAGGPPQGGALAGDADAYRAAVEANCIASIRMAQAAVVPMREARWGRICFIASSSVKQPVPFLALSNTARAALAGFAKTLATEVATDGITVNLALPGTHDTDRIRELGATDALVQGIPAGRLGSPDDFGDVVAFLCSEPAKFVTGTSILVDGGRYPGLL